MSYLHIQYKFLEHQNKKKSRRIPGELVIFSQNPGDSRGFREDLIFPGVSRRVATLCVLVAL